jgi:hypothetical protein
MRLHVSRGLWRLWLVCSILWAAGWSVVFYSKYEAVPQHVGQAAVPNPKHEPCSDSIRGKASITFDEAHKANKCVIDIDQKEVLQTASIVILGVPVFVLVLGFATIWIGRGFVRPPT